jgi:hypothetical protein
MTAQHRQQRVATGAIVIGNRYRVLHQLGRGGMGEVYRVLDTSTSQTLALKLLRKSDPRLVSEFEREYQVLAQLQHPHVIAVHNYGVDPAGPFYTMELLEGGDLLTLAPIDYRLACRLLFEVCSSLALLHSRRLVHGDVSPRNIRLTLTSHAKLIDFGTMTAMGPCTHFAGTPGYIAPEIVQRGALDARTDLFSLGATLYYALTGRPPFVARDLSDQQPAYAREPPPPSERAADIPPALDALCASLLRIDPARRPQTAFEVMRRLEIVAGLVQNEPLSVSRAYLTTPALVGRQEALHAFSQRMKRALRGQGSALCFEGARGVGRSRLLEACALEAKTLGATVIRAQAHTGRFALAQQLGEQLLQALPKAAPAAAEACGVQQRLFYGWGPSSMRLRNLADPSLEPGGVQAALFAWIAQLCAGHTLFIAVDDVERVDPDSLALLAALAMQAREGRLMLVISCQPSQHAPGQSALSVLTQHCSVIGVRALTRPETQSLLASIFGDVPQLVQISESLYKLALGHPRETLALTQHLVDTDVIRYQNGRWALPAELAPDALPASIVDAFAARVRALPLLARRLLELQGLLGSDALAASEYPELLPEAPREQIDEALELLCARELLQRDGGFYSLSHRALGETLAGLLGDAERRERHWTLYQFYQRKQAHPIFCSHQLLEAGHVEAALDLLAQTPDDDSVPEELVRANPERLTATLERALELTLASNRPARDAHELRRRLCVLGNFTDSALHQRFAASWISQVQRDAGLDDYRALPDTLEPAVRLQQALATAMARYAATPERDRVYNIQEAIKNLCLYVVSTVVVVSRTADNRLLAGLPNLLQPFAAVTPVVFALWQNALALEEFLCFGRLLTARQRWGDVYDRLGALQDNPRIKLLRNAVAFGIGMLEASLGRSAAFSHADQLDDDPRQRVGAMHIRSLACSILGDTPGAERYRRDAALLAVRSNASPMFESAWGVEYVVSSLMRDLAGLKRVIDGVSPLAKRHRGWLPVQRNAEAQLQLLCGDAIGGLRVFTEAQQLTAAKDSGVGLVESWVNACAGVCAALTALDRCEDAIAAGEAALARCAELGMQVLPHRISVPLALAEAKHGRIREAARRVDAVIEEQLELGVFGVALAASYEARAKIAIATRDAEAVLRLGELAIAARADGARAFIEPLFEEARAAGLSLGRVNVSSAAAALDPVARRIAAELDACKTAEKRSARALELICELAAASGGWLYLVTQDDELTLRATRQAPPPDAHALRFAHGFFEQHVDDAGIGEAFTQTTLEPRAASYVDARGAEHRVLPLCCEGEPVYVGLAV